jgi:hypothetical protein
LAPRSLVEKDVAWEIGTTDAEGEFTKVATSYDGQVKFVVPAVLTRSTAFEAKQLQPRM